MAESYDAFCRERVQIGKGMMSTVYSWRGFAYKCFSDGYPPEWIAHEMHVQSEVCSTLLPVVRYYESEFPNSIKMDLIDGETMVDRIKRQECLTPLEDLMSVFATIHEVKGLNLPDLSTGLRRAIPQSPVTDELRERGIEYLEMVETTVAEEITLCHLDYHFLNLMYKDGYKIIDWIGAQNGMRIFDYARTYVIMFEFVRGYARRYLNIVYKQCGYDKDTFEKAIVVMALHRLTEYNDKRVHDLIDRVLNDKL